MDSIHLTSTPRGVTMVESLIAVAVTTFAGAAVLTSLTSAMQSSTLMSQKLVANGLAQQLMDEITATRFPRDTDQRPTSGASRDSFNDIDDYDGWSARPPMDRHGREIGTEGQWSGTLHLPRPGQAQPSRDLLASLTREVQVERLTPSDGNDWTVTAGASPYRRVTVTVAQTDGRGETTVLAQISGVFCEVPFAP